MKTNSALSALYEHSDWHDIPQQVYRPGGLAVTELALSYCDLLPGARVLDIGCGTGSTLIHLLTTQGSVAFGLDISAKLLHRAWQSHPDLILTQASGEHLPFGSKCMEVVISECTLSIFDDVEAALSEWSRILKPDGYFVASDLYVRNENGISALRQLPPGLCINAAMTRREIIEKIERCGLIIETWNDYSDQLINFPICTFTTAAAVDPFDLYIAAARAKLGYYFLVARKR